MGLGGKPSFPSASALECQRKKVFCNLSWEICLTWFSVRLTKMSAYLPQAQKTYKTSLQFNTCQWLSDFSNFFREKKKKHGKNQILGNQCNVNTRKKIFIILNILFGRRSMSDASRRRKIRPALPSHRILSSHPWFQHWLSCADTNIPPKMLVLHLDWFQERERKMWPMTTFLSFPGSKSVEARYFPTSQGPEKLSTVFFICVQSYSITEGLTCIT